MHTPPPTHTHTHTRMYTYSVGSHHHTHAQCQSRTETWLQKFPSLLRHVLSSIILLTAAFDWTSVFILLPKAADKTCHFSAPHISQMCGSTVCRSWGVEKFKRGEAAPKQRSNSKVWYTVACHLCPQFKWLHFVRWCFLLLLKEKLMTDSCLIQKNNSTFTINTITHQTTICCKFRNLTQEVRHQNVSFLKGNPFLDKLSVDKKSSTQEDIECITSVLTTSS